MASLLAYTMAIIHLQFSQVDLQRFYFLTKSWLHQKWTWLIWIVILLLTIGALSATHKWSKRTEFMRLDDLATRQLDLYIAALDGELQRHAYLASLLEVDADILALLDQPSNRRQQKQPHALLNTVNQKLTNIGVRAGANEVLLISNNGYIVAASDWYTQPEKIGQTFNRYPATLHWLNGKEHAQPVHWFMANPHNQSAEYYFAHPLYRPKKNKNGPLTHTPIGWGIVKISLAPMESTWVDFSFQPDSEKIIVLAPDEKIILSSVPAWKNQMLVQHPRGATHININKNELAFWIEQSIVRGAYLVRLFGPGNAQPADYIVHERYHPQTAWRIMILHNPNDAWHNTRVTLFSALAGLSFLHLFYFYFLLRRKALQRILNARNALQNAHDQLERKVAERTQDLYAANEQLKHEMHEREQAEAALLHANKMAALGQMSAKIAHEVSQPLTALRAIANNSKILLEQNKLAEVAKNIAAFTDIVGRMNQITLQLKKFSGKTKKRVANFHSVKVQQIIDNSRHILTERIGQENINLQIADAWPQVKGDSVQLEQVFTNLFSNAMDAMREQPDSMPRLITVSWQPMPDNAQRIQIKVTDNGPGITEEIQAHLFEPFHTSKPAGTGLGLGLVISANIVFEHGGTLRANTTTNINSHGASFVFDLEIAEDPIHV